MAGLVNTIKKALGTKRKQKKRITSRRKRRKLKKTKNPVKTSKMKERALKTNEVRKKKASEKKSKKKSKKIKRKKVEAKPKKLSRARALKIIKYPDAEDFLFKIAGEDGLKIFTELIKFRDEIDEFTLAEKAGLQINYARSLLYKLYEYKLVEFSRERDKKKGWFIYSWKAFPEKIKEILIRENEKKIEELRKKESEVRDTFVCENCNAHFDYTKAIENMFFCDKCGGKLKVIPASDVKEKIEKEISELKKKIKTIEKL